MARPSEIYCIDTSALVDLGLLYPRSVFDGLWTELELLVANGRCVAPREVGREIARRDDEVSRWVRRQGGMIINPDAAQLQLLADIMAAFPDWVDRDTQQPVGDPWVIALARSHNPHACVVAHENIGGPGARKIPNVCQQYGVDCIRLLEMVQREGWTFVRA